MVKPVSPAQPLNGEGSEKYEPNQKRDPSEFDKTLEKEKAERARAEISKMSEETRTKEEAERPRTYAERLKDMGYYDKTSKGSAPKGGGGVGYVPGSNNPFNPDSPLNRKKGGVIRGHGIERKGRTKGRFV